jgi:hypothetical protein
MKPKKPDRWGRAAKKAFFGHDKATCTHVTLKFSDIANLLRMEHKAVMRMVRNLRRREQIESASIVGYRVALTKVLSKLKERAK